MVDPDRAAEATVVAWLAICPQLNSDAPPSQNCNRIVINAE
jgi:hypothetical protein